MKCGHVADLTTQELNDLVRINDPGVFKFFGAKLESSPYMMAVRNKREQEAHERITSLWPRFSIKGSGFKAPPNGKAWLWDAVTVQKGSPFLVYDQKTGSCVGNGFGQAMNYLQAVEAWQQGQSEQVLVPYFWLWDYGISRWILDPNDGPGEGSMGSAIAEAATKYGLFAYNEEVQNLVPFDTENETGVTWGEQQEMAHSFINPTLPKWQNMFQGGKSHLVKTSSLLRSADETRDALINGYTVTTASNWGGLMQCPVVGSGANSYLQNRRADTWPHQMCILGWWDHPTDGELFFILNSWSIRAHGVCPTGAPKGGFWVKKADINWIASSRDGELIAYSNYDGYPAQMVDWGDIYRTIAKRPVSTVGTPVAA
jgi:hypothetical protein